MSQRFERSDAHNEDARLWTAGVLAGICASAAFDKLRQAPSLSGASSQ